MVHLVRRGEQVKPEGAHIASTFGGELCLPVLQDDKSGQGDGMEGADGLPATSW